MISSRHNELVSIALIIAIGTVVACNSGKKSDDQEELQELHTQVMRDLEVNVPFQSVKWLESVLTGDICVGTAFWMATRGPVWTKIDGFGSKVR